MIRSISVLVVLVFACASFAQVSSFDGPVNGAFINPTTGVVIGLGTNDIQMLGSPDGQLTFTGNANATPSSGGRFLVGRLDFSAGGATPESLTLRLGFDAQRPNGTSTAVYFCTPFTSSFSGEPGFRTVNLDFGESRWTSRIGTENYTLEVEGITRTETWDEDSARDFLQGVVGGSPRTGFVWATLNVAEPGTQAQSDGSIGCGFEEPNDCGCNCQPPSQVPEPTTWAMILSVLAFAGVYAAYRRMAVSV
jgi:hypothetical protein